LEFDLFLIARRALEVGDLEVGALEVGALEVGSASSCVVRRWVSVKVHTTVFSFAVKR
jgi:hypothetical protein